MMPNLDHWLDIVTKFSYKILEDKGFLNVKFYAKSF